MTAGIDRLVALVRTGAVEGQPAHAVERTIWNHRLELGRTLLDGYFRSQGTGDVGPHVTLPDGTTARRLEETHTRNYRSVFGDLTLERTVYGSREGQAIAFVPLDNRLQRPASDDSYRLQQWDQLFVAESSFNRVSTALESIPHIKQSVDCLQTLNRQMAQSVEPFRDTRPIPEPATEGAVFVASADGKGIVMQREPDDPAPKAHRGKGDKANKKRMAIVGSVYSVGRHVRTPEEVTASLFRDGPVDANPKTPRPEPVGKHVWGRLSKAADGSLGEPIEAVFGWMAAELDRRNPEPAKDPRTPTAADATAVVASSVAVSAATAVEPVAAGTSVSEPSRPSGDPGPGSPTAAKELVCVMDGRECLWDGCREYLRAGVVPILDRLHVLPRLWQAAHLFHKAGTAEAAGFVRERRERVLAGQSRGVVIGLRRMGTVEKLCPNKKARLETICRYLVANESRMRYDQDLAKGYPIASGVIEGGCRSYVKDRMERSGMKWTKVGAQAMLDVRSEYLNGDWGAFHPFRIKAETERLYPHKTILQDIH